MQQLKYHEFAFRAAAEREDVMNPPPPIVWSLCPPWPWRWWFEPTMRGWTAARSKWVTCPFSNGIEPLIRSGTIPNPPPGRVSVPVVVSVRVQVVWDRLACCKMKKILNFITYRKVASSRPVYYSIFDNFWGATNQDVLLNEMCYYFYVQKSMKWKGYINSVQSL